MRSLLILTSLLLLAPPTAQAREAPLEIAITIDDLPVHAPYPPGVTPDQVSQADARGLTAAGVPATGVVNAVRLKEQPESPSRAGRDWRAAGLVLGNHAWSHPPSQGNPLDQFESELTKDEPVLREARARDGLALVPLSLSR